MNEKLNASPWLIEENKYSQHVYIYTDKVAFDADALHVCRIDKELNINWQSDLRLIFAAPDLLEALKGVLRVADRQTDEFDAARAAITKATFQNADSGA